MNNDNKAAEDLFPQPELEICEQPGCCGGTPSDAGDCTEEELTDMVQGIFSDFFDQHASDRFTTAATIYHGLVDGVQDVAERGDCDQSLQLKVLGIIGNVLAGNGEQAAWNLATLSPNAAQESEAWKVVERLAETAKRPLGELLLFCEEVQMAMKDATHLVETRND